ncbi:NAD-dependent epimerase/dehydratase family protein [Pseudonocardia sp. GCM10023141]|uniref:NAD-dependent epimerase/dehydratase family protein n=1 Tax=Pseudonocardia sp. GCM10023141 TaxID=3252653 RepID=UPI00361AC195
MSVLVIGSAGLIGHAVRTHLEARGAAVVAPDRDELSFDGFEQTTCDVTDLAALERIMSSQPVSAIVHCGAASGPVVERDDPRRVIEINVGGTANRLEIGRRHRIPRFGYCSSIAAYGTTPPAPVPETAPLRPLDGYGATKAAGEHLVAAYAAAVRARRRRGRRSRRAGRRRRDRPCNITGGAVHTIQDVIDSVRRTDQRCRAKPAPPDPDGAARWPARLELTAARTRSRMEAEQGLRRRRSRVPPVAGAPRRMTVRSVDQR